MTLVRYAAHFARLRSLIGFRAATAFALAYLRCKMQPPTREKPAAIPLGPYVVHFSSLPYFAGLFNEIFLEETYYLAPTHEPLAVIDAGANIGLSLLYIKLQVPRARVQCFEPNPAARAMLERNIAANGWKDVQ